MLSKRDCIVHKYAKGLRIFQYHYQIIDRLFLHSSASYMIGYTSAKFILKTRSLYFDVILPLRREPQIIIIIETIALG